MSAPRNDDPAPRHYIDQTAEFSAVRPPKHAAPEDAAPQPPPLPADYYPQPIRPPQRHVMPRSRWWVRAWQWIVGE